MSRRLSFVVLVVLALSLLMVLVMANKADGTCLCCKYRTKYQGIATASCISDLSKLRKLGEQYACPLPANGIQSAGSLGWMDPSTCQ
jgi:hypothetical protein